MYLTLFGNVGTNKRSVKYNEFVNITAQNVLYQVS